MAVQKYQPFHFQGVRQQMRSTAYRLGRQAYIKQQSCNLWHVGKQERKVCGSTERGRNKCITRG